MVASGGNYPDTGGPGPSLPAPPGGGPGSFCHFPHRSAGSLPGRGEDGKRTRERFFLFQAGFLPWFGPAPLPSFPETTGNPQKILDRAPVLWSTR